MTISGKNKVCSCKPYYEWPWLISLSKVQKCQLSGHEWPLTHLNVAAKDNNNWYISLKGSNMSYKVWLIVECRMWCHVVRLFLEYATCQNSNNVYN